MDSTNSLDTASMHSAETLPPNLTDPPSHTSSHSIDETYDESSEASDLSSDSDWSDYPIRYGKPYSSCPGVDWVLPIDSHEIDRLACLSDAISIRTGWLLHFAPIAENALHVLDLGTGQSSWVIRFAERHPAAVVEGMDFSPLQPSWVPPNAVFFVQDAYNPLTWSKTDHYDFIRASGIIPFSPRSPQTIFEGANRALKSGGWMEVHEWTFVRQFNHGTLLEESPMTKWENLMKRGMKNQGLNGYQSLQDITEGLTKAGFVNIKHLLLEMPLGEWMGNKQGGELIGRLTLQSLHSGIEGLSKIPILEGRVGLDAHGLAELLRLCKEELKHQDLNAEPWWPVSIVWAQKA